MRPLVPSPIACLGVILAGGRSQRMGQDKSQLLWHGQSLLQHLQHTLVPQVATLMICGGQHPNALQDTQPHLGPLGGIQTALQWMAHNMPESDWLLSSSCDTPLLPHHYAATLMASVAYSGAPLFTSEYHGRLHFTHSLWNKRLLPQLEAYLHRGGRAMKGFFAQCQGQAVAFAVHPKGHPFANINTPEDYAALLAQEPPHAG